MKRRPVGKKVISVLTCPCCKAPAYAERRGHGGIIKCSQCSLQAFSATSLMEALQDWNTREPDPVENGVLSPTPTPEPTSTFAPQPEEIDIEEQTRQEDLLRDWNIREQETDKEEKKKKRGKKQAGTTPPPATPAPEA